MRTGEELWIVVVLCSIALAYFAWRIRLWRSRFKWSRTLLPRSGQLSWKVPLSDHSPSAPDEKDGSDKRKRRRSTPARPKRSAMGSSAPDVAVAPLGAVATLAGINPEVLHAIQVSTAEQLRGVDSIGDYVQANFHDFSAASAESWMQRLEDYVAGDSIALGPVIEVKEAARRKPRLTFERPSRQRDT